MAQAEEDEVYDDAAGAEWYAAAAEGEEDDEVLDLEVQDDDGAEQAATDGIAAEDPYAATGEDPYLAGAASAEADSGGESQPVDVAPPSQRSVPVLEKPALAMTDAAQVKAEKRPLTDMIAAKQDVDGDSQCQPTKLQRLPDSGRAPPAPPMPLMGAKVDESGVGRAGAAAAPPAMRPKGEEGGLNIAKSQDDAVAPPEDARPDMEEVPELAAAEDELAEGPDGELSWDERVVVVRQGQVQIELQHRNPPMVDATLLRFCEWLDQQMPLVVENFPYVRRSGAYVDLSDNVIGPEGLDRLFTVLRSHRVPCVVLKAYRNVLDDSIVDTLIEYLYTQPESFPMHGIHISHNNITDKGAMRLIRAAAQCGHYPRLTTRLPLWLRLECNNISNPQQLVVDCGREKFNVCLMGDGLCSRPDCDHYSGLHVQLPYFLHQFNRGPKGPPGYDRVSPPVAPPPATMPPPFGGLPTKVEDEAGSIPDWKRQAPKLLYPKAAPKLSAAAPTFSKQSPPLPPQHLGAVAPMQAPLAAPGAPAFGGLTPPPPPPGPGGFGGYGGHMYGGGYGAGFGAPPHAAPAALGASPWDGGGGKAHGGWASGGKGGKKGGKGGGGGFKRQMWQGLTLTQKVKQEVKLPEGELSLGFQWQFVGAGHCPSVVGVDPQSLVAQAAMPGYSLLRVNGLDTSMFSEKQISDMLRQRPLALRFGDQ